jgi:hypothetical protein
LALDFLLVLLSSIEQDSSVLFYLAWHDFCRRSHAPKRVYLIEDAEAKNDEPVYGLLLVEPIGSWRDAAHMPVRVARENLSIEEIESYMRFHFELATDSLLN